MAQSILSTLTSKPQFVATNENTGTTIWSQLGIVDVEVSSDSANTDMPISNQQVSDGATYQSILAAEPAICEDYAAFAPSRYGTLFGYFDSRKRHIDVPGQHRYNIY